MFTNLKSIIHASSDQVSRLSDIQNAYYAKCLEIFWHHFFVLKHSRWQIQEGLWTWKVSVSGTLHVQLHYVPNRLRGYWGSQWGIGLSFSEDNSKLRSEIMRSLLYLNYLIIICLLTPPCSLSDYFGPWRLLKHARCILDSLLRNQGARQKKNCNQ